MNIKKIIREELENLDWIKKVSSSEIEPRKGDKVEVINRGGEFEYMGLLGMYRKNYSKGIYGNTIIGEVIKDNIGKNNNLTFKLKEETTGDEITFPHYSSMGKHHKLNLYYKILNIY